MSEAARLSTSVFADWTLSTKTFSYPSDLHILNELPCFLVLYDYLEEGNPKKLWAPAAWLEYVDQDLDQFQRYDLAGKTSEQIKKAMYAVAKQVQQDRKLVMFEVPFYPRDDGSAGATRVEHVSFPVSFNKFSTPLCATLHYNVKQPPEGGFHLNYNFQGQICARRHKYPEDLDILNALPLLTVIYDFSERGNPKKIWANAAWLGYTKDSLEKFQAYDFAANSSSRMKERQWKMAQKVQFERKVEVLEHEMFPHDDGKPVTMLCVFRPIVFEGWETPLIICCYFPPEEKQEKSAAKTGLLAEQVLNFLDVGAVIFDNTPGSERRGTGIWAAQAAQSEYNLQLMWCSHHWRNVSREDGTAFEVGHVVDSCLWPDENTKRATLQSLLSLALSDPALVFRRQKRVRDGDAWNEESKFHQFKFSPAKDPTTGRDILILEESDVTIHVKAQAELQASNELKDRFMSCLSHELRTPVHGILNLSGTLAASPQCPERMRPVLQTIEESAQRLAQILFDIFETQACLTSGLELQRSARRLQLRVLCDLALDSLRPRMKDAVAVSHDVGAELWVYADEARIGRVLSHLIENAIKFTDAGTVRISAEHADGLVRVRVRDSGCGIAAEMRGRVWDKFVQGDMSAERVHGGTGLGLAMVKALVTAHGGDVAVESVEGSGSTFSFTLPTRADQVANGGGQEVLGGGPGLTRAGCTGCAGTCDVEESVTQQLRRKDEGIAQLQHQVLALQDEVAGLRGVPDGGRRSCKGSLAESGNEANGTEGHQREKTKTEKQDTHCDDTVARLRLLVEELEAEVSQGRRAKEQLEARLCQLESESRRAPTAEMVSVLSHELKNPLAGIIGLTDALVRHKDCTPPLARTLHLIQSSGERLAAMVGDILDRGSLERGTLVLQRKPVALHAVADSVCGVLAPLCPATVTLSSTIDPLLVRAAGDEARVNQILTNLVGNALKFTASGSITVSAHVRSSRAELRVAVTDTGIGIPACKLDRIWERFTQADKETSKHYGGTGLGLSLVKDLVEAQHGRVGVASVHGGERSGSTFYFDLPVSTEPDTPSPSPQHAQWPTDHSENDTTSESRRGGVARPARSEGAGSVGHYSQIHGSFEILSVDDNLVNHAVVENSLAPSGYVITKCMGGEEALSLIASRGHLPDLVLLDVMMPGMSGYDMCRRLRESYPSNTLPVIMVSAKSKEDDIIKGLKVGSNDYLTKPFGSGELTARIQVQLNLRDLWILEIHRALNERQSTPDESTGQPVTTHKALTVLVCDSEVNLSNVKGWSAKESAGLLDDLYNRFDAIVRKHGLRRVLDDAYVVVKEDMETCQRDSAESMLAVAGEMLSASEDIRTSTQVQADEAPAIRLGIASGSACSVRVGVECPQLTCFGPALRKAVSLAQCAHARCVVVSAEIASVLAPDCTTLMPLPHIGAAMGLGGAHLAKLGQYPAMLSADDALSQDPTVGRAQTSTSSGALRHVRGVMRRRLSSTHGDALDRARSRTPSLRPEPDPGTPRHGFSSVLGVGKSCAACEELSRQVQELQLELQETKRSLRIRTQASAMSEFVETHAHARRRSLAELSSRTGPSSEEHIEPSDMTILSVDDDPVNHMVIESLLEPTGHQVLTCMNGIEALELLRKAARPPDLILLDWMMPHISGIQCCHKIRQTYNRMEVPIIMVSAKSGQDCVVEGLEAGCNDFVSKPFNRVELFARISTQLRLKEAHLAQVEHARTERALQLLLPRHVASRLSSGGLAGVVEQHESVTVVVAGIVGFSDLCAQVPGPALLEMMNQLDGLLDELCCQHGCCRALLHGHVLMAVGGHDGKAPDHAMSVTRLALDLTRRATHIHSHSDRARHLSVSVGVHSSQACSGVVGSTCPRYCFFGDAVETAATLQRAGCAERVQVSAQTARMIEHSYGVEAAHVPGSGDVQSFLVIDPQSPPLTSGSSGLHLRSTRQAPLRNNRLGPSEAFRHLTAQTAALVSPMANSTDQLHRRPASVTSDLHQDGGDDSGHVEAMQGDLWRQLNEALIARERAEMAASWMSDQLAEEKLKTRREGQRQGPQTEHLSCAAERGLRLELSEARQKMEAAQAELLVTRKAQREAEAVTDALRKETLTRRSRQFHTAETGSVRAGHDGDAVGLEDVECAACRERIARLEDARVEAETVRADNARLLNTCSSLADQVRLVSLLLRDAEAEAGTYSQQQALSLYGPVAGDSAAVVLAREAFAQQNNIIDRLVSPLVSPQRHAERRAAAALPVHSSTLGSSASLAMAWPS